MLCPLWIRMLLGWGEIPNVPGIPVRRHQKLDAWCIADSKRYGFIDGFYSAILSNVTFVHKAVPMTCIPGKKSTGEAIGTIMNRGDADTGYPKDAVRTIEIVYNQKSKRFHEKGKEDNVIDSADYLVLKSDGSAIACWKN